MPQLTLPSRSVALRDPPSLKTGKELQADVLRLLVIKERSAGSSPSPQQECVMWVCYNFRHCEKRNVVK